MARRRYFLDLRTDKQRGVTLIELLIVVTILAFASAVVIVNAPPSRAAVRNDAEQFAAKLTGALDLGLLTGVSFRLELEEGQYYFARFDDNEWKREGLPPLLGVASLAKGTKIEVESQDRSLDNFEAITGAKREESDFQIIPLDAIGVSTGFRARFSRRDQIWTVSLNNAGNVEVLRAKS